MSTQDIQAEDITDEEASHYALLPTKIIVQVEWLMLKDGMPDRVVTGAQLSLVAADFPSFHESGESYEAYKLKHIKRAIADLRNHETRQAGPASGRPIPAVESI